MVLVPIIHIFLFSGHAGTVVGWGKDESGVLMTEEPKQTNLPVVSQEKCLASNYQFHYITSNRTFCAGKHLERMSFVRMLKVHVVPMDLSHDSYLRDFNFTTSLFFKIAVVGSVFQNQHCHVMCQEH